MKRDLFRQMKHEWIDNVWLVVGLAIVSLTVWWFSIVLYNKNEGLLYSRGFDPEDVYVLDVKQIPANSPLYADMGDDNGEGNSNDLRELIAGIRSSQNVEAAAFSVNGIPYSYSFQGNYLRLAGEVEDTIGYSANFRYVSPDMARILRFQSRTGKPAEELERILRDGGILVSNVFKIYGNNAMRTPEELNGNIVEANGKEYRVGDIINQVRRSDFDLSYGGMVIFPIDEKDVIEADRIAVRVKSGKGEVFREEFENTPSMKHQRNMYLADLKRLTDEGKACMQKESTFMRYGLLIIVALVFVIMLGMLGTFWFRMQQRVCEIAIRKVCGATSGDIFRRVISESLILLLCASVLAGIIGWVLIKVVLIEELNSLEGVAIMEILTAIVLAIGIVLSIWWPAKKAMQTEPAVAVKDE